MKLILCAPIAPDQKMLGNKIPFYGNSVHGVPPILSLRADAFRRGNLPLCGGDCFGDKTASQ
jgi:hypothetical protein